MEESEGQSVIQNAAAEVDDAPAIANLADAMEAAVDQEVAAKQSKIDLMSTDDLLNYDVSSGPALNSTEEGTIHVSR